MIMTASAPAPSPSMTSARTRRHTRSSSGSTFSPFAPLPNVPRRARSDLDTRSTSPPASRVKKASFTLAGSSDDDDDDCPLVREVNQRARMAKLDEHFGDFSFDAEAHKAKTSKLQEDDDTETETEADFPPTPVGDAAPTPKLTISTDLASAPVPFPVLSPSPVRSGPLPPLTIPDRTSPVVRSASSPFLSSPVAPKPEPKLTPASSVNSTSPYNSGTSTPILLKNGRPLKPSLKSRVSLSMSTPDVSSMLAQAKSAPSTPRVHFPTRERLESVVLFDKRARPLEVASGDSPIASPRSGFFADMDTAPGLRIRTQSSFPFPSMSPRGSPLGSSVNLQGLPAAILAKTKLKIAVSRSAPLQPVPRPGAHVHLAAVRLLGTRMSGSVLVKNVSFSKKVTLRYTFDNWETTSEVGGMWSSPNALKDLPASNAKPKPFGSEETELDVARGILVPVADGWDRFVFNIKLDDVAPYLSKRSMFLAVKFEAAGAGEWWDNCGGLDYRFEFDHVPKAEPKTESPAPTLIGRPRSNTSPAPLNTDSTQTDLPSATLLSAKLNSVVEKQSPRPNLKLQFPSDEAAVTPNMTSDLGAELVAPKVAPVEKKVPLTLTPPDSTASSPCEAPAPLPVPAPAPAANLPSPAESPASRKQPSPLPSPSAVEAPAHSTTNIKDQSYADFLAKYCFAGGSAPAPASRPAPTGFSAPAYSPPSTNSWGSPQPNFGWGASTNAPAHNSWGGVGFSYGRSGNSFSGGDL